MECGYLALVAPVAALPLMAEGWRRYIATTMPSPPTRADAAAFVRPVARSCRAAAATDGE